MFFNHGLNEHQILKKIFSINNMIAKQILQLLWFQKKVDSLHFSENQFARYRSLTSRIEKNLEGTESCSIFKTAKYIILFLISHTGHTRM